MSANNLQTILKLKLSGRMAHFRKFYTNASSLTYTIPPRTSICGIVGSILELPRDSYYDQLSSEKLRVAIRLCTDSGFHKQFFTLNNLGDDKCINNASSHKQCRMELLLPNDKIDLYWIIYLGITNKLDSSIATLEDRIIKQNLGFGIYLGQRQFRASIELMNKYSIGNWQCLDTSEYVDTAVLKENVADIDMSCNSISLERIPLDQTRDVDNKSKVSYRRTARLSDVMFDISGKRMAGSFNDVLQLRDEHCTRISFL